MAFYGQKKKKKKSCVVTHGNLSAVSETLTFRSHYVTEWLPHLGGRDALFFPSHVFTGEIPTLVIIFVRVTVAGLKQQTATKSWKWTVLLYPVASHDSALKQTKPAGHTEMGKGTPAAQDVNF